MVIFRIKKLELLKPFWPVLVVVLTVVLSYGQILKMQPWEDDNALMFKLAHIQEAAGFLGPGVFGEGPYRYTATPYYLVYLLFGYMIPLFYALALTMYAFATLTLYGVFRKIFNNQIGLIAGLLFAGSYVVSDSFIRLFNSVSTSFSIIGIALLTLGLWSFYQTKKWWWYGFSLVAYVLITELTYVRAHYLIGSIILFLGWSLWQNKLKTLAKVVLSLVPFLLIFLWQYIYHGDSRSAEAFTTIQQLLHGQWYFVISLISGVGFLIMPDQISVGLSQLHFLTFKNPYYVSLGINLALLLITLIIISRFPFRTKFQKSLLILVTLMSVIWWGISRWLFLASPKTDDYYLLITLATGGYLLILTLLSLFYVTAKNRLLIVFFSSIILLNILSYCFYDPTVFLNSYNNRYLTHSYFGLIGLLVVWLWHLKKKNYRIVMTLLVFMAFGGIILNITNQQFILKNRSAVIAQFYQQLHQDLPQLQKGSVLYFAIAQDPTINIPKRFSDAVNSAQMPLTTAIAWRYGLDRYDFQLVTDPTQLSPILTTPGFNDQQLHVFQYQKNGLIDQTSTFHQQQMGSEISAPSLEKPFLNLVGGELMMDIQAQPTFQINSQQHPDLNWDLMAGSYEHAKQEYYQQAKVTTSSSWQDHVTANLVDQDVNTAWQADRVIWKTNPTFIQIELPQMNTFNRLVFVNSYRENSPTDYWLESSNDGQNWSKILERHQVAQLKSGEVVELKFSPISARFFRLVFQDTDNHDAPAVSEIWPIPDQFSELDLLAADSFLQAPFQVVDSVDTYRKLLEEFADLGEMRIEISSQEDLPWHTLQLAKVFLQYDNQEHHYTLSLPANGESIEKIRLTGFSIPGTVTIKSLVIRPVKIN